MQRVFDFIKKSDSAYYDEAQVRKVHAENKRMFDQLLCMVSKLSITRLDKPLITPKESVLITVPKLSACFFQVDSQDQPSPFYLRVQCMDSVAEKI